VEATWKSLSTSVTPVHSGLPVRPACPCHIPAGTPHDFAPAAEPLVLSYCLIRTRPS
jgi:hypothetical protein